jgi:hypothetical protein
LQKLGQANCIEERYREIQSQEFQLGGSYRTVSGYNQKQVCSSGNLEDSGDINRARNNIRENIKTSAQESIGYCESKSHKLCFDKECSEFVDRIKQAKLQWLQDLSEVNEDNLSNVWREDSRHFRNKKREYLKGKINELESNSKNKNVR